MCNWHGITVCDYLKASLELEEDLRLCYPVPKNVTNYLRQVQPLGHELVHTVSSENTVVFEYDAVVIT